MPDIPNSLALTTIADGASIIASDHRNNYAAISTGTNGLITALSGGSVGQFLRATDTDTVAYAYPPGYELAYAEITAGVSVTATTDATADNVVSAGAVTFDGSAVILEFFAPYVVSTAGQTLLTLYDNTAAVSLGRIFQPGASIQVPAYVRRRFTPAAGSRTYSIRAHVGSGTGTVGAGAGGAATTMPAFIRITKA